MEGSRAGSPTLNAKPGEIGAFVAPSGGFSVLSVVSCSIVTVNDISPAAACSISPIPKPRRAQAH
jgi:hypothetical protein